MRSKLTVGFFLIIALFTGCASPPMKGTPFYSADELVMKDPDRIPLWPLVYKNADAFSVLWPLIEKADDHFAFRPFMSVYEADHGSSVYNIIWPLVKIGPGAPNKRAFPIFWGKGYVYIFPTYLHEKAPSVRDGVRDFFFPFWYYRNSKDGWKFNCLASLIGTKNFNNRQGWHIFPLAGSYRDTDGRHRYSYLAFPLWHDYVRREGVFCKMLLPVFGYARDTSSSTFCSLLYSRFSKYNGEDAWSLLLPIYYHGRSGDDTRVLTLLGGFTGKKDGSSWMVLPLLSGGRKDENSGAYWIGGPIAHSRWDEKTRSSHILPFYYKSTNETGSTFMSLPWSSQAKNNGDSWQMVPPVFINVRNRDGGMLFTPLYASGDSVKDKTKWRAVMPLYYSSKSEDGSFFNTLLGGYRTDAEGRRWMMYPLLSWGGRRADGNEFWALAPLFHVKWDEAGTSSHLLPIYYWNSDSKTLVSPLLSRWQSDEKSSWLIPPALSMLSRGDQRRDLWTVGPLVHTSWGPKRGSHHIFPLYYAHKDTGTFVSAAYTRWESDGKTSYIVPPALSWRTKDGDKDDLHILGSLARFSLGKDKGSQHILPLYYANKRKGTLVTPLYAKWEAGRRNKKEKCWFIPPLLTGGSDDGRRKRLDIAFIFNESWGKFGRSGYLLPLYLYGGKKEVYTPIMGWDTRDKDDSYYYPLTPLFGIRTGNYSGCWLFPLFSHKSKKGSDDYKGTFLWSGYEKRYGRVTSNMLPIYHYENNGPIDTIPKEGVHHALFGKEFWSLPHCWYRNQARFSARKVDGEEGLKTSRRLTFEHGFFPLWSYSRNTVDTSKSVEARGRALLVLYNYRHNISDTGDRDYTRAQLLWKVWDYERENEDVSVDAIGGLISYDKRKDIKLKQVSVLWRLFRYNKSQDGTKVDLLFLPIYRGKGKQPDENESRG